MKTYSAMIIEDEPQHRDHLLDLLHQEFPAIHLVKVCKSGREALEQVPVHTPDLLFLDIDLGDMNAFELLHRLNTNHIKIIFTTAYQDWALKAFQVNALHYLLKPVQLSELQEAIKRLDNGYHTVDIKEITAAIHQYQSRVLAVKEKTSVQFLQIDSVMCLQASESYSMIHYEEPPLRKTIISSHNLCHFEQELQLHGFLRVHKSWLVNAKHIRKYDRAKSELELHSGEKIPVSRQKKYLFG